MPYRLLGLSWVLGMAVLGLAVGGCASGDPGDVDATIGGGDGGPVDAAIVSGDGGPPCTSDSDCDDGVGCNGAPKCGPAGYCEPAAPVSCDDGVACTVDSCVEPDGACNHVSDDEACTVGLVCDPTVGCSTPRPCETDTDCDDGQLCNGVETCDPAFGCRRGAAPDCDDGLPCTMDACSPTGGGGAGACSHVPNDSVCDDADVCNGAEVCDVLAGCRAGAPLDCDDGVACTADGCEATTGCANLPDDEACDDGVFCNGAEVCDATMGCRPGPAATCDDGIGCTTGRCDTATDACVQTGDDAMCDDTLACNGAETCDASGATPGMGCVAGTAPSCDDGLSCTTDVCSEPGGTCSHAGSDADGDGYTALGCGAGDDCNDSAMAVNPGATEVCDGIDNDCSGSADDGAGMACVQGASAACTTSCGTAGTATCSATCSLGTCRATSETCNACDDDGDGTIDNGLVCPFGSTRSCVTPCGRTGIQACNSTCSGWGACTSAEVCNGCDDDGVGGVDNGFACSLGQTQSCTTTCGTSGTQACDGTCSGFGVCTATEVCNGCDDDGVGGPDNGFTCAMGASIACTTACGTPGTQTCNGTCSAFSTCYAPAEVCGNGCDDDGVGGIDNGCTANDECAGAVAITLNAGRTTVSGNTSGATNTSGSCYSGNDVWYRFTLTRTEVVYINTYGSTFDTGLGMRDGTCGAANNNCTDDTCSTLQSQIVRTLTAGTYYIQVDGFGGASGSFTLNIEHLPVGNDGAGRLLASGTTTRSGTTSGTGILSDCRTGTAPEHMYYWTQCPSGAGGAFSATTCTAATAYDTVIYLHSGAIGGSVTCNDDVTCSHASFRSTISATVPGGAGLYGFYVDGFSSAFGAYSAVVTRP